MTMVIYGLLAAALLFATFALTKERVLPEKEKRNKIKEDLKDLFRNKPWVLAGAATLFQLTYIVKIGRASCRERVWKRAVDVAGIIKIEEKYELNKWIEDKQSMQ